MTINCDARQHPALIAKLRTGIQEDLTYLQPALEGEPEPGPEAA